MTDELTRKLFTDVTILRRDKEKLEAKAKQEGEDIATIIEWLVEEYLDEL